MPLQFFVGGNFKMNPTSQEQLNSIIRDLNLADLDSTTEIVIAPPSLYLNSLKQMVRQEIQLSAQNCFHKESGAFTGEISPAQLADAKIPYVILGHSERRSIFNETSEFVAQKTIAALNANLKVIFCVGETLQEREAGLTATVVQNQLQAAVSVLQEIDWSCIVIAYEPVWAIGTGKVATSAQAQEAHADIRAFLSQAVSSAVAQNTRIIYGGSVTGANCQDLSTQPDVNGFLVGGASLKQEFVDIINARRTQG